MTVRVALVVAVIACGSPRGPAPAPVIEKPPSIATSPPDASPPAITRKPFKVAWRKSGAGEGGFAHAVAVRPDGAVVIAGEGHLGTWSKTPRARLRPAFVAMLDATGTFAWSREFGPGTIEAVASTPELILACGTLDKTGLVVMALAPDGKQRWRLDAAGLSCNGIVPFGDELAITGTFVGERMLGHLPVFPRGDVDVFVAVIDLAGKPRWVNIGGSDKPDTGHAIIARERALTITGWFEGIAVFQAHTLELARRPGARTTANPSNAFLAAYEPTTGHTSWATSLGVADSFDRGWALAPASTNDDILVAGDLDGHAFLARYDSDGVQRWLREAAGTGRAVVGLPEGDILLATFEHGDTGTTTLARYAYDGELIDRARFGGSAGSMHDVYGMARNAAGRIAIVGLLRGDSTITGELASSTQTVADKTGQGIVIDVLDP